MTKNYYVVPHPKGGWDVKTEHAQRASTHEQTQAAAEREAKRLSANQGGGEVRIQRPDGTFRDSDTIPPARDPYPPRDRKH